MSNCGKGTLTRPHPSKPATFQYLAAKCHKLSCKNCGPAKARIYRTAVFKLAAAHQLQRHVTLTLDPGLIPQGRDSVVYIQQVWSRFRSFLARKRGLRLTYIRVLEFQENGTAHYHLLIHETLAQDTLLKAWVECGGGHQVRIRFRDGKRGASYVTKYITKELLLEIPLGTRRISTAQGLRLLEPHVPTGWEYSRLDFYAHMEICFGMSFSEAWNSTIKDYFEHESPPDDVVEFVIYGKSNRKAAKRRNTDDSD